MFFNQCLLTAIWQNCEHVSFVWGLNNFGTSVRRNEFAPTKGFCSDVFSMGHTHAACTQIQPANMQPASIGDMM
jgi:hypothetical protein